jgi:hypothetical protein
VLPLPFSTKASFYNGYKTQRRGIPVHLKRTEIAGQCKPSCKIIIIDGFEAQDIRLYGTETLTAQHFRVQGREEAHGLDGREIRRRLNKNSSKFLEYEWSDSWSSSILVEEIGGPVESAFALRFFISFWERNRMAATAGGYVEARQSQVLFA